MNTDMTGNDMTLKLEGTGKLGTEKTYAAKFDWSMDLEGPTEGSTFTPFVGADWDSKDGHVRAKAGMKFASSLSSLTNLF